MCRSYFYCSELWEGDSGYHLYSKLIYIIVVLLNAVHLNISAIS